VVLRDWRGRDIIVRPRGEGAERSITMCLTKTRRGGGGETRRTVVGAGIVRAVVVAVVVPGENDRRGMIGDMTIENTTTGDATEGIEAGNDIAATDHIAHGIEYDQKCWCGH